MALGIRRRACSRRSAMLVITATAATVQAKRGRTVACTGLGCQTVGAEPSTAGGPPFRSDTAFDWRVINMIRLTKGTFAGTKGVSLCVLFRFSTLTSELTDL